VPGPQYPFLNPQETAFIDQGFHKAYNMANGKAGDASETLIGNPGMLPKEVGFGENGV
jgi:hypothetical protein